MGGSFFVPRPPHPSATIRRIPEEFLRQRRIAEAPRGDGLAGLIQYCSGSEGVSPAAFGVPPKAWSLEMILWRGIQIFRAYGADGGTHQRAVGNACKVQTAPPSKLWGKAAALPYLHAFVTGGGNWIQIGRLRMDMILSWGKRFQDGPPLLG